MRKDEWEEMHIPGIKTFDDFACWIYNEAYFLVKKEQ